MENCKDCNQNFEILISDIHIRCRSECIYIHLNVCMICLDKLIFKFNNYTFDHVYINCILHKRNYYVFKNPINYFVYINTDIKNEITKAKEENYCNYCKTTYDFIIMYPNFKNICLNCLEEDKNNFIIKTNDKIKYYTEDKKNLQTKKVEENDSILYLNYNKDKGLIKINEKI